MIVTCLGNMMAEGIKPNAKWSVHNVLENIFYIGKCTDLKISRLNKDT